jgi:hypothetical protein
MDKSRSLLSSPLKKRGPGSMGTGGEFLHTLSCGHDDELGCAKRQKPTTTRIVSTAAAGDAPKAIGIEASSADERAIDLGEAEDVSSVLRID